MNLMSIDHSVSHDELLNQIAYKAKKFSIQLEIEHDDNKHFKEFMAEKD